MFLFRGNKDEQVKRLEEREKVLSAQLKEVSSCMTSAYQLAAAQLLLDPVGLGAPRRRSRMAMCTSSSRITLLRFLCRR